MLMQNAVEEGIMPDLALAMTGSGWKTTVDAAMNRGSKMFERFKFPRRKTAPNTNKDKHISMMSFRTAGTTSRGGRWKTTVNTIKEPGMLDATVQGPFMLMHDAVEEETM